MKSLKQFLEKKKKDANFKRAGPGQQLGTSSSTGGGSNPAGAGVSGPARNQDTGVSARKPPSSGSQRAGEAALARLDQKKQKENQTQRQLMLIRSQARKELEEEMAATAAESADSTGSVTSCGVEEHSAGGVEDYTVAGVLFRCPFVGPDVLPLPEIEEKIREMLFDQLKDESAIASCLIIKTCNKNTEMLEAGLSVILRYLDNIIQNPSDAKYRRIRCANKVYQQRVSPICGSDHFLSAVGFSLVREQPGAQDGGLADIGGQDGGLAVIGGQDGGLAVSGGQDGGLGIDENCVWQLGEDFDPEYLKTLRDALVDAEPIVPELDRNVRVLKPAQTAARIQLPPDFFNISMKELNREEKQRRDLVDDLSKLQTKAMREKARARELRQYRYCLVRIRFPDNLSLQGTFRCSETVSDVFAFVREHLAMSDELFSLLAPSGGKLLNNDSTTLVEANMAPSILLIWHSETIKDGAARSVPYIKDELLAIGSEL